MSGINEKELDLEIIKALADETRIDILSILGKEEMNVSFIASKSVVSRPTISHHLQILRRSKLVISRREGKEIFYSINMDTLRDLSQILLGFIGTGNF